MRNRKPKAAQMALRAGASQRLIHAVRKPNCVVYRGDCRELLPRLKEESIHCIITSPPYGALKDYGSSKQVGFGQHLSKQYLPDMQLVLNELFRVAKPGASLWLVLDSVKNNGQALLLPWELAQRAQVAGWTCHDIVVWDKGKSLPWSHNGRFRGVCEFVMLLSKGRLRKLRLDNARDANDLSAYWVKYPERFNPKGKAPTDLWHIPIPVQGSWSKAGIRHLCPFPPALVTRIVELSTKKGDVILDPFAGTGVVPAVSAVLGRKGIGLEINKHFVTKFRRRGFQSFRDELANAKGLGNAGTAELEKTLIDLRVLKYPRTLFVELSRGDRLGDKAADIEAMVLRQVKPNTNGGSHFREVTLDVLVDERVNHRAIQRHIANCQSRAPLSKFGIHVQTRIVRSDTWRNGDYVTRLSSTKWYAYRNGHFYRYKDAMDKAELRSLLREPRNGMAGKYPLIAAPIAVSIRSFD
jgi:DNA modification methylase